MVKPPTFLLQDGLEMAVFEPQLAKPLLPPLKARKGASTESELAKLKQYAVELKYDGHRRLMASRCAWSRPRGPSAGLVWTKSSAPLFQRWLPDGFLLDGEIVPREMSGTSSHNVTNLLSDDPSALVFVVFDILYVEGGSVMDAPWNGRRKLLETFFEALYEAAPGAEYWLKIAPVFDDVETALEQARDLRLEGVMLKDPTSKYRPGSRNAWVKHKFTETYDVVITDCDSESTEWTVRPGHIGSDGKLHPLGVKSSTAGLCGLSYGFWDAKRNQLRRVGALGWTGTREKLLPMVGRVLEVKGYGQYPTGAIRHPGQASPHGPMWRTDKSPENCVFDFGGK